MTWLIAILLIQTPHAKAEYRAFELVIYNATSGQERIVVSSLDPRQYQHYYPVRLDEQVTYRQTWMCRGNTSNYKSICPKPAEPESPAPNISPKPA